VRGTEQRTSTVAASASKTLRNCGAGKRWFVAFSVLTAFALAACDGPASSERIAKAREFLAQGRPNGAVVELKLVLQSEPENGQARRLLGLAYVGLGKWDAAEKELVRARDLGVDTDSIRAELARVWASKGDYAKVIDVIRVDPQWPVDEQARLLTIRGDAYFGLGDWQQAEAAYRAATELRADQVEAIIGLTRVAVQSGDSARIAAAVAAASRIAPAEPYLMTVKANLAFSGGDYDAAGDAFKAQLATLPESVNARLGLAQALMGAGNDDPALIELDEVLARVPGHPKAHYLHAVVDLRRANYAAARLNAERALAGLPDHQPSAFLAGVASYALGDLSAARWHLKNVLRVQPGNEIALTLLRATERQFDDIAREEAARLASRPIAEELALFRLGGEPTPGSVPLRPAVQSALRDVRKGDIDAAIADLRTLSAQAGETHDAAAGYVALLEGRQADAVAIFERAQAAGDDPAAILGLALAHYRLGEASRGRLVLESWLADHDEAHAIRRVLSDLYLTADEAAAARPHLDRLLSVHPQDPAVLNNLAWTHLRLRDAAAALRYAERAVAVAPNDSRVLDTLAMTWLQLGKTDRALQLLQRATRIEPVQPDVFLHLAQAMYADGNLAGAREVLDDILASANAGPRRRSAEALLKALER
jgi:tetratricopeptide (TPR) repeat protein